MKSSWKIPTLNYYLWRAFLKSENFLNTIGVLWQIRGKIYGIFENKKIQINKGNVLINILLKKGVIGYNIEDLYLSKRMGTIIHKKKKKKSKKKKGKKNYIVNPIGIRLHFHGNWKDGWVIDMLNYTEFLHVIMKSRRYIYFFFLKKKIIDLSLLLSHIVFMRQFDKTYAYIYLYNGKRQEMIDEIFKELSNKRCNDLVWRMKRVIMLDEFILRKWLTEKSCINKRGSIKKATLKRISQRIVDYKILNFFYINLRLFLIEKLTILTSQQIDLHLYNLQNNGISAEMVGRYLGLKIKNGFTIMELMNPLIREYKRIYKEEGGFYGFKIKFSGRFKRRQRSQSHTFSNGRIPLSSISKFIDYNCSTIVLRNSICSIKVWFHQEQALLYNKAKIII